MKDGYSNAGLFTGPSEGRCSMECGLGTVNLPHTWNAKDMQVKADAFYEGVGYYRKTQFFGNELKRKRVFLRFERCGPKHRSVCQR